jgi:DNA-binding NtrC family response regulator
VADGISSTLRDRAKVGVRGRVLVAGAPEWLANVLVEMLGEARFTTAVGNGAAAIAQSLAGDDFDVVLLDAACLAQERALLDELGGANPCTVLLAGSEDSALVLEALQRGASDWLTKPLDPHKVEATVALATAATQLARENRALRQNARMPQRPEAAIGCSPAARRLATVISHAADTDATVLIEGAPGTGKTTLARAIHERGRRADAPLVLVDGNSVGDTMDELLARADRATLLIEDVHELPAAAQARLVRHLKERPTNKTRTGDGVRIVATTSARLPEMVARGAFREDLLYRINVLPIVAPSLTERRDDIPMLAVHFLREAAADSGSEPQGFTAAAMILLETHPWPGNLAQLRAVVHRAHALAGSGPIDRAHLFGPATGLEVDAVEPLLAKAQPRVETEDDEPAEDDIQPLANEEKRLLARALRATKGNVRRAAQLLRIGRATLYRKIQVYDLRLR